MRHLRWTATAVLRLLYAVSAVSWAAWAAAYLGANLELCDPPSPPLWIVAIAFAVSSLVAARLALTGRAL